MKNYLPSPYLTQMLSALFLSVHNNLRKGHFPQGPNNLVGESRFVHEKCKKKDLNNSFGTQITFKSAERFFCTGHN